MRTMLRGKVTLLFMTLGLLLAVPAVALADVVIISNDLILNQNATKNSGDTGTAYVNLTSPNQPSGDTNGCNAGGSAPLTVTLSSNNTDVTFPSGNTAELTGCGVPVGVSYKVDDDAQGGTAVISVDSYEGGRTDGTRLYTTTDTLTITIIDTAPPRVTSFSPTGASEPINTNVTATFNEPVDGNTITDSTFKLEGPNGAVAASRSLSADKKTATLNPDNDLAYSTTYTATVVGGTSGVKDLAGNGLDQDRATAGIQDKTWTFTTEAAPVTYTFNGFFQPVDNKIRNDAKGGSTIPLKFEVLKNGVKVTDPSEISSFVQRESCLVGGGDPIEEYSSGNTSLRYDTTGGYFIFNWKTPKAPGTCYGVTVSAGSSSLSADFGLK